MGTKKIDLLPYVDFDVERCIEHARRVNPDVEVRVSATTREGGSCCDELMGTWLVARGREALPFGGATEGAGADVLNLGPGARSTMAE